jgi:hypothetical protein
MGQNALCFAVDDTKARRGILMAQDSGKSDSGKSDGKTTRQDRLKLALRENLRRRKAQARERGKMTDSPSTGHETSLHEEAGSPPDE